MTIQGRRFDLDPSCDRDELQKAALDAIQGGGAIVGIPIAGGGEVSVLLSRGVPVFFETHAAHETVVAVLGESFEAFDYQATAWQ